MLMQATQAFIFKERRLASLVWLWGVLGTLILFLLVDYLTTFTLPLPVPLPDRKSTRLNSSH